MWWIFVVIGILLMALEVVTPGFLVMWFGISFIITAIPIYLHAPIWIVVTTYLATLLALTVFARRIFDRMGRGAAKTGSAALVGTVAVVIEEIDAIKGTGRVRAGKEVWSAISSTAEVIAVDEATVIERIEGVKLVVKKKEVRR